MHPHWPEVLLIEVPRLKIRRLLVNRQVVPGMGPSGYHSAMQDKRLVMAQSALIAYRWVAAPQSVESVLL